MWASGHRNLPWLNCDWEDAESTESYMTALTMFAQSEPVNKLWELDVLGIQDPQCKKSNEERDRSVRAYFLNTASERGGPV